MSKVDIIPFENEHAKFILDQPLNSKLLELKTVPVHIADLTAIQAKAYRIADNRLNEDSEWDYGLLNLEFTDLMDNHFDVENLGFYTKELENLIVHKDYNELSKDDVLDDADLKNEPKELCVTCGQELK